MWRANRWVLAIWIIQGLAGIPAVVLVLIGKFQDVGFGLLAVSIAASVVHWSLVSRYSKTG